MRIIHLVSERAARIAALALLVLVPHAGHGQVSPIVSMRDPVYQDLDRIIGAGLVDAAIIGQRPYNRREVARLIAEARASARDHRASETTARALAKLARRFAAELALLAGDTAGARAPARSFERFSAELLATRDAPRALPIDSIGRIDASIAPMLNGRGGRRYGEGPNLSVESEHFFRPAPFLGVQAAPHLVVGSDTGHAFAAADLHTAWATLESHNLLLDVGRQETVWGQSLEGGLLMSTSGRPLDMVRLSTDRLFVAPWIFRYLGKLRATAYYADLGRDAQRFPHSVIVAYKLSGQVTRRFELASSVLGETGGEGGPPATFMDRVVDLVPPIKYTISHKNRTQFTNKFAGVEYRFRIPELAGLQLYAEHQFDDMDPRRWRSTLWQDGGHIVGFSMSELGSGGAVSAAAEYHHTGVRFYEHDLYTSGVTFHRTMLGDPLGTDGNAGYLRVNWNRDDRTTSRLDLAIERRSGDVITAVSEAPNDANYHFVVVESHPAEWRYRATGTWARELRNAARVELAAGYERTRRFQFVEGANRNGFLASLGIQVLGR